MSYHKKNLKHELIAMALSVCAELGWEAVNMRDLANRIGVSHTALYRHFKNKEELLAEVIKEGFRRLAQAIAKIDTNKDGFTAIGVSYIEFGLQQPSLYDLMFGLNNFRFDKYPELKQASNLAFDTIIEGVRLALGTKSEAKIMTKSYQIWASVHGLVGILRRSTGSGIETPTLQWIRNNLAQYLKETTFS